MGGPDRGFGASSNNINTKGWYVQPGERQTHQPFVSKQSTLEHQSDNQNASAKSGFNKSRLGFNNSKGQRNFAQPSEKSLASRQSTPKSQNDNVNLSSNSGLGRGRKGLENRGRMNISQSSEGLLQTQSKNQVQNKSQLQNKNQAQTVTAADRAARFGTTSKSEIYAQMKKNRVVEREQAIKDGLIPDPNAPRRLEDAIDFRGTCETKCPEFEMIEREIQNNVDRLEMDENGNLDRNKAVKAYRRSAAGNDQPLPADVRSPEALISTLDYLIKEVMSNYPLEKCHAFIRDRTRSIRQDFTLQNIRDVTAVEVHERIARFHILCLHEMCGMDESKFSEQQETEQLRKVLLSLMEFYEDLREEDIETPNEAEFRAYYIITHIRDKDVVRQISSQPAHIFKHPYVKQALKFHAMAQRSNEIEETSSRRNKAENAFGSQNNYASFFKLVADPHTSFLMACLLETHFPEVRKGALKAMNVAYMARAAGVEAEYVRKVLCYDSLAQCLKEAKHYGIGMDMSLKEPTLLFGLKHYESRAHVFLEPLSYFAQRKSVFLVEAKKDGKTFSEIVNGNTPKFNSAEIDKRIQQSLAADHVVMENEKVAEYNKNSVWDAEDFGLGISRRILRQIHDFNARHPNISQKLNWQLIICTEDTQLQSSAWFKRKFNLDNEFLRNVDHYTTHNITSRMVVPNAYPVTRPIAEEIGGVVFAIPEQNGTETPEEKEEFWVRCSNRLAKLVKEISMFNPTAQFPMLITYFPISNETEATLKTTPYYETGNGGNQNCGRSKLAC
ncbi:hypothetical protein G6F57_011564 [Rhizopus arrhizus]|nr:hypothetical protein G6F20_011457 [Rhizopus arrhizus]KAG0822177.1 hypothetical protein G6F19_011525 [Rhizopus arrhizus]KAG0863777.1 hypothetical protein G6F16_011539 [Rhizopus arrhizus]KAG1329754.1 hypothetical protein G6F63_011193 [Rhizopus arrhizus]KAG1470989.1 hypothetical protein G6F57_011564 [Rhizopus arrhizus]